MRPAEEIENMVRKADCEAPDVTRRRLWKDIAETLNESELTTEKRGDARVWRILMNNKIAKLAIAAVVVVAALAVGVERFTRTRPDKTLAFSAEIRTNMALDLDPKAAIPLRQTRPEDFDVTWDGENGGTLRIMPDSSLRLATPSSLKPEWNNVVAWAHSILPEIAESTTTSVSAHDSRFAAILTSEGNLAVVQIGDYDESKARLQWQVEGPTLPGYGPVQVVTLACVDPGKPSAQPCAIDFDTGRTSVIPAQVLNLPAEDFLDWLEQNGIDAIARMTDEGGGLTGVGLTCKAIAPGVWTIIDALRLRDVMSNIPYQSRDPILFEEGRYQVVVAFKTREGGIGILQMRDADRVGQTTQFRYKMVQPDSPGATEVQAQEEDEALPLYVSARWLCDLGKYVLIYANDHEDRLPQSLEELREFAESEENYQWMVRDVEYLGAGLTCADSLSKVVAYDRTLLGAGKGTNVLFLDSHIEYVEPEKLAELGLPARPGSAATAQK